MGTSYSKQLEKTYLDLTLATKQMQRQSKKREQESLKQRKLVEKYLKKNEMEVAKIHAENAIRSKSESVNFLRLSARLDAVSQRVKSALSQHTMSKNMKQVVTSLGGVLKTMDAEKIAQTMDKFESQFDTLDVRTKFMDSTISNTTATATPQEDVTSLMNQIGEHIGIQVSEELDASGIPIKIDQTEVLDQPTKTLVAEAAETVDSANDKVTNNDNEVKNERKPAVKKPPMNSNQAFKDLQDRLDKLNGE